MLGLIIVFLLLLPFLDFYLLFEATSEFGILPVTALILITGLAGAELLRREGRTVLFKLQNSVTLKEASRGLLEGLALVFGGLALLTPGFVTDLIGLLLVWSPTRQRIVVYLSDKLEKKGNFEFQVHRI